MEILFLGTSAGWPLPRLGCNCSICTSSDSKDHRLRPSVLINKEILFDVPPDIYHQLRRFDVNPTFIECIAITHAHDDHIMGLYDLSKIYNRQQRIKLISTLGVLSRMRKLVGISMASFEIIEVEPKQKIDILKDISLWFIPVSHGATETYAIKAKASKPIVYAPEFRRILPSDRKFLGDSDLAVIDGSSKTLRGQAKGHETIEEGIRFGKSINAKRILFTNIGHKTDTHEGLEKFVKESGGNKFGVAYDGMRIRF